MEADQTIRGCKVAPPKLRAQRRPRLPAVASARSFSNLRCLAIERDQFKRISCRSPKGPTERDEALVEHENMRRMCQTRSWPAAFPDDEDINQTGSAVASRGHLLYLHSAAPGAWKAGSANRRHPKVSSVGCGQTHRHAPRLYLGAVDPSLSSSTLPKMCVSWQRLWPTGAGTFCTIDARSFLGKAYRRVSQLARSHVRD